MADLTITAANVVPGSDARMVNGFAGETIAQGKAVYKASTGLWMLADANSATALARAATGIAVCGASANQPITVQQSGQITIGATLTANLPYFLSDTPGGIGILADIGTGEYGCLIGMAISTTVLQLSFNYTGVAN
jgi:hypothetical protein